MSPAHMYRNTLSIALLGVAATIAAAQCRTIDFENAAIGAPITTHYGDVYFYIVGQTCDGDPPLYMRVQDEFYGDEHGSKVLQIDTGCPDFSDDYLRMIFMDYQDDISFLVGPYASGYSYAVRAYDSASGGTLLETQVITPPGTGFVGVRTTVQISRPTRDVRRVEVEASGSGHEAIDNLVFGQDDTAPTVQIDSPAADACVCGEVLLEGIVCDDDGAYDRDRLEVRRVWPTADPDWTLVREFVGSQVCTSDSLYEWDVDDPNDPVAEGLYIMRVTAVNECGLTASDEITVYVDSDFDTVDFDKPTFGSVVGGDICFDGTLWDMSCFEYYTVKYRPTSGGLFAPVDPGIPTYDTRVANDPFAWWTAAAGLPDGQYEIQAAGHTQCGATASKAITITLDNTPPVAELAAPSPCQIANNSIKFTGTATDANLDHWELQYWDPWTSGWVDIHVSTTPVAAKTLYTWDVSGLSPCFYAVRLRVWDTALVNICDDVVRHRTDRYLAVGVGLGSGIPGDVNCDGAVNFADIDPFVECITSGTGCAPCP